MCGRYVLALRPSEVCQQLEQSQMPVDEVPDDNDVRQSYNFAPGYHGLVYRADGPDSGGGSSPASRHQGCAGSSRHQQARCDARDQVQAAVHAMGYAISPHQVYVSQLTITTGLVPFWTKRNPDYGSKMKTINCRDDSLVEDRGMWTTMKRKKRCIIVAQGFYEWLKKNNAKDKLPHFSKRKDGQLMCFAGLWDCVQFEGKPHFLCRSKRTQVLNSRPTCSLVLCSSPGRTDSPLDSSEKLFTYTIITTSSNKQLNFLHDRMPVILENGSEAIRTWLDPSRTEWSKELQSLLRPFEGELDVYPVSKEVGKVGNNSPSFLVPIHSAANKNNIANFFGNQQKVAKTRPEQPAISKTEYDVQDSTTDQGDVKIQHDINETRVTTDRVEGSEDNAPMPIPATAELQAGGEPTSIKRERTDEDEHGSTAADERQAKRTKTPKADGSLKITSFFSNK
ncbi:similar to DUF159 domain protein [Plenodomus lingam JN3]|uniref:Similar to DUF159 domain protein n=1 Tax=Leptosphaeria maculans (strain JN3 / isolate v23.1.3 / race Av1-4-5-6-7-8) TaxID=985895 RepID=E4ZQP0_LEPMJ|nr:similar to DUF159 domain protein [Plenodomus lingam JN3]CBX94045.1 similar to DUF159 domain protein [Plenodomus lingam JN3]